MKSAVVLDGLGALRAQCDGMMREAPAPLEDRRQRAAAWVARTVPWAILLACLLAVLGCQHRHPDFMTRVHQDCAAGQKWACDLIESLNAPLPEDTK